MTKFPKIKEIGRRVNKNIDILLNMFICEFKSLICSNFLTSSKLICLIYNCIFYIINLLEINFIWKKKNKKLPI